MQRLVHVIIGFFVLALIATSGLTASPASAAAWPVENVGASGPDVVALQYLLQAHGYSLSADGSFGPQTQQAVERFQKAIVLSQKG